MIMQPIEPILIMLYFEELCHLHRKDKDGNNVSLNYWLFV